MKHPDILLGTTAATSPERIFAEESFLLLGALAVPNTVRMDGYSITCAITDPIELISEGDIEVAFRLRNMPTFSLQNGTNFTSSDRYLAIHLEYGELTDDDEDMDCITEQDFTWHDYVLAVINTEDVDDVTVMDAMTGRTLSGEDLGRALFNLQEVSSAVRQEHFIEEVNGSVIAPIITRLDKGYAEFKSEEHLELSSCYEHSTENVPCEHNPFTLN